MNFYKKYEFFKDNNIINDNNYNISKIIWTFWDKESLPYIKLRSCDRPNLNLDLYIQ